MVIGNWLTTSTGVGALSAVNGAAVQKRMQVEIPIACNSQDAKEIALGMQGVLAAYSGHQSCRKDHCAK